MQYKGTLNGLIECLQEIKKRNPNTDDIPICINLIANSNLALKSICYEKYVHGEEMLYIEADLEDKKEYSTEFDYYEI